MSELIVPIPNHECPLEQCSCGEDTCVCMEPDYTCPICGQDPCSTYDDDFIDEQFAEGGQFGMGA